MNDETNDDIGLNGDAAGYSAEELLEQAQINAQALASDKALLDSWIRQLAATFIRGWDTEQDWTPADILYALVTNYQSFGAEIEEAEFEAKRPQATISNLPNLHLADALGIDPIRMHHLFRIGEDLTSRLGGTLTWTAGDDGGITLRVGPS